MPNASYDTVEEYKIKARFLQFPVPSRSEPIRTESGVELCQTLSPEFLCLERKRPKSFFCASSATLQSVVEYNIDLSSGSHG